jgi:hypothetical protein
MKKESISKLLFTLGSFFASLLPIFAHAQTQIIIATSVPGTYGPTAGTGGPGAFVANFYQFALIIGGILAFGVIVYGGIKYMLSAGNPHALEDAKEWIEAALLGLLLLAGAYFILSVINPQLLNLNLPSLSGTSVSLSGINVPSNNTGVGGTTNGTNSGSTGGVCQAPKAGPCTVANLQNTCMGSNAAIAAGVCNTESSGAAAAGGDLSTNIGPNGKGLPASVGLFQINLSANTIKDANGNTLNCPSAFSNPFTGSNPHTTITNMTLYNQCVAAAQNPALNIAKACQLAGTKSGGMNWSLWGPATRKACNV